MINYVQRGNTLTVTAPYALLSGGGCQVGNIFGVTVNNQNPGDSTELVVEGVFDLAKDGSTFVSGAKVYWDNSQQLATANTLTAAGAANKEIGFACLDQASGVNALGGQSYRSDRARAVESAGTQSGGNGGSGSVDAPEGCRHAYGGADHGDEWRAAEHFAGACGWPGARDQSDHRADEARQHAIHGRWRGDVPVSWHRDQPARRQRAGGDREQRHCDRKRVGTSIGDVPAASRPPVSTSPTAPRLSPAATAR